MVYEGAGVGAANRRHLFADHQGSIISLSDAGGALLAINRYDDWGTPDATNLGRFQYTGQAWIPELGLYHYKARIYSPTLGRFLQTDPIGYEDGLHLYAYVRNDPVNARDPTGTTCVRNSESGQYECRIDNTPRNMTAQERALVNAANRHYTRAVNRLLSDPNRVNTVPRFTESGVNGGSFQISNRSIATALINPQVSYVRDSEVPRSARGSSYGYLAGGGYRPLNPNGSNAASIALTLLGLAQGDGVARTLVHEGIHGTREEYSGGLAGLIGHEPYRSAHGPAYTEAACNALNVAEGQMGC